MAIPRVPTFFPETRLYFTRRIQDGLYRFQHLPFGARLYNEYRAEAERLEGVIRRRQEARRLPHGYRRDQDSDDYEAVYSNNTAQRQPMEERFRHLSLEKPENGEQLERQEESLPENYADYQTIAGLAPAQSPPTQGQFNFREVENHRYSHQFKHQQRRRQSIKALLAERALRVLEERHEPNFHLRDPPQERQRNRLERDYAHEQQLEHTLPEPHPRPRTRESDRQASSRQLRRIRDPPNRHLNRSATPLVVRRDPGDLRPAGPPTRNFHSRRTTPSTNPDFDNEEPMMFGALQPANNVFMNDNSVPPNDASAYGEGTDEEIYPEDSASRASTPEPGHVRQVPSILRQPNWNIIEDCDVRRDTTAAVVDGDIAETATPHVYRHQQPWSWENAPGASTITAEPSQQPKQPRQINPAGAIRRADTVAMSTDAVIVRYGGLRLTTEQQRQKDKRARMMRSATIMESGKKKDVK